MAKQEAKPETYQVREYPLEVLELLDEGGGFQGYYAKGFQSADEFVSEANYRYELDEGEPDNFEAESVEYHVWRCVPTGDPYMPEYWLIPAQLGTRGAFPATVMYA